MYILKYIKTFSNDYEIDIQSIDLILFILELNELLFK